MDVLGRSLLVAWRRPDRLTVPVAVLARHGGPDDPEYVLWYLKSAVTLEGFQPLPGLADVHRVHRSTTLFPVIANRLMSRDRPNHERFLNRLGLDADADIFDELERGGGARVTDSIELFPVPRVDSGVLSTRFFVRGIRHVEGGPEAARRLREGSRLFLRPEPDNPVNDRAVLLDVETGVSVGYAPDYLADVIHTIHQWAGDWPSVVVERVNRDAPAANMVLAELSGTCPRDYRPFSETDYAPLARDLADLDAALSEVGSNALG